MPDLPNSIFLPQDCFGYPRSFVSPFLPLLDVRRRCSGRCPPAVPGDVQWAFSALGWMTRRLSVTSGNLGSTLPIHSAEPGDWHHTLCYHSPVHCRASSKNRPAGAQKPKRLQGRGVQGARSAHVAFLLVDGEQLGDVWGLLAFWFQPVWGLRCWWSAGR